MIKIMFVCFGNICRSPMAEFVMKDLIRKAGLVDKVIIESAGCHASVGTPMSSGTREQLNLHNILFNKKQSAQLKKTDYDIYDYIIGMDKSNVDDMKYLFGGDSLNKVHLMMKFADENRDVDDPWYTDDFAATYSDVLRACKCLLNVLPISN